MADKRTPIDKKPSWFKMHDSIAPAVKYLPKEIAGEGFQAAMVYYTEGIEPDLSKLNPAAISIYAMLKSWIDEAAFDMRKKAEIGKDSAELRWGKKDAIGTHGYPSVAMGTHADKNRKEKEKNKTDITTTNNDFDDDDSHHHHHQNLTTNNKKTGGGGGDGDDDISKLVNEFSSCFEKDVVAFVYDYYAVGEHITSRYAYARAILNRCAESGYLTIHEIMRAEDKRHKQKKPRKPMDERNIEEDEFDELFPNIDEFMNRERSTPVKLDDSRKGAK